MMFGQQYHNPLPYSSQQQTVQMVPMGYVPQLQVPADPTLTQLVPRVASALVQEIQEKATRNPLRMFLLNQMGQNGYVNQDFGMLLRATLDYIAYGAKLNRFSSVDQAIQMAVGEMVELTTAVNVRQFPALGQNINMMSIQPLWQRYDQLGAEITQFRNSSTQAYPGVMQSYQSNPAGFQQPYGAAPTPGYSSVHGAASGGTGSRSGVFQSQSSTSNPAVEKQDFNRRYTPASQAASEPAPQPVTEDITKDVIITFEGAEQIWRPSKLQWYRPAYAPSRFEIAIEQTENNVQYKVKPMDQAAHRITPLFGPVSPMVIENLNVQEQTQKLSTALSQARNTPDVRDVTLDNFTRFVYEKMQVSASEEEAWVDGHIRLLKRERERAKEGKTEGIDIAQWTSINCTPIISDSIETTTMLKELTQTGSFSELVRGLNFRANRFKKGELLIINELMTAAVNRALANQMSLPKVRIGSFIDDIDTLVPEMEKALGENFGTIFKVHQGQMIRDTLSVLEDEAAEVISRDVYGIEDADFPVLYFKETVSYTLLNCVAPELDLDFVKSTAAQLTETTTPVLYELGDVIMRDFGKMATRHLIRTNDRRVLELTRGWWNSESLLISLVK